MTPRRTPKTTATAAKRPRSATTADTLVYQTEKLLKEQGEKFEGSEKADVESALAGVKDALNGTSVEAIKDADREAGRRVPELQPAPLRAGLAVGRRRRWDGGPSGDGAGADESGADDEVVDAEIVDEA